MKIGIYPGTFDPVTKGHLDIIKRSLAFCDRLIVAVAVNHAKQPLFSDEERVSMIKDSCIGLDTVEVTCFQGLLADFCIRRDIRFIVRGLRNGTDFEYEMPMALMNKKLSHGCETLFLLSDESHQMLSSSILREILRNGGDISSFIPSQAIPLVNEKKRLLGF